MSIEASAEGEKTPTFEMVAYNGGKLRVGGFNHPVVVELQTAEFEGTDQTYVNRHHDQKRELGHSTERRILPTGIYFSGVFSHDNEDTKEIIVASKRGKKFKASIEASFPPARFVQRGQSAVVNGKRHQGPFYIARNAVITGVAILTRAADMDSNVQIAAEAKKMTKMNDEIHVWISSKNKWKSKNRKRLQLRRKLKTGLKWLAKAERSRLPKQSESVTSIAFVHNTTTQKLNCQVVM
jgi:hypothetical protein